MKNQDKTTALEKMLNGTLEDYILYIKGLATLK
jgi:hypothetical protein